MAVCSLVEWIVCGGCECIWDWVSTATREVYVLLILPLNSFKQDLKNNVQLHATILYVKVGDSITRLHFGFSGCQMEETMPSSGKGPLTFVGSGNH